MTVSAQPPRETILRWLVVVILSIAFGYIEAAVVVYLRGIFHPDGFYFPLPAFGLTDSIQRLLLIEVGREAATLVVILSTCILAGHNRRQRFAYFMTIFAVWDIFYYVWLKVLLDWPVSIMDWDILFLIPVPWAGPVLAPILVSITMLVFAVLVLCRDCIDKPVRATLFDWVGFCAAALVIVISFCIPGRHISQPDYASYFSWVLFCAGLSAGVVLFARCFFR